MKQRLESSQNAVTLQSNDGVRLIKSPPTTQQDLVRLNRRSVELTVGTCLSRSIFRGPRDCLWDCILFFST